MNKIALIAALALAGSANAATISYTDSFGLSTTNWTQNLSLQQFDSALGTLNSVTFNYGGGISTIFSLESLDAAAANISANAAGDISFGGPISDTLHIAGSSNLSVTPFDGTIDFGGTSGGTVGPVVVNDSNSIFLNSGFAAFIGNGTFDILVAAIGLSNASGAGNLISQINTEAVANIEVVYNYSTTTNVPEPATLGLLGLGLLGLGVIRRRKA